MNVNWYRSVGSKPCLRQMRLGSGVPGNATVRQSRNAQSPLAMGRHPYRSPRFRFPRVRLGSRLRGVERCGAVRKGGESTGGTEANAIVLVPAGMCSRDR